MRDFRGRDPVRIGLIGIVLMVLGMTAALNSENLPVIGGGTAYRAEFGEAAGLARSDDVRIAGVKVGKVSDIELRGGRVEVTFTVKNAWLGDETSAAIKIETLLGKKYLSLDPRGPGTLDPKTEIPRGRTMSPYDVLDTFRGLSDTVDKIDTQQLAHSFDVLSQTFAKTPNDLRGTLTGLQKLSNAVSSRDQQLAELLANAKHVSQTLADRDAELQTLLRDGNTLLSEVFKRKQAITSLLEGTRALSAQLQGLISDNDQQLDPVLAQLDRLTGMLQRNQTSLDEGIKRFAPFLRVFTNTTGNGRWFDGYICGLLLPSLGPVNEDGCNAR